MFWNRPTNAKRVAKQLSKFPSLSQNLERRMEKLLKSTQKTSERKGFYGNLLLYGRPGTGKTLWAEKVGVGVSGEGR